MIVGGWEFVGWAYGITYGTLACYGLTMVWRTLHIYKGE